MIRLIHLYFTLQQPFTEAAYTFDYLTKVFGFLSLTLSFLENSINNKFREVWEKLTETKNKWKKVDPSNRKNPACNLDTIKRVMIQVIQRYETNRLLMFLQFLHYISFKIRFEMYLFLPRSSSCRLDWPLNLPVTSSADACINNILKQSILLSIEV